MGNLAERYDEARIGSRRNVKQTMGKPDIADKLEINAPLGRFGRPKIWLALLIFVIAAAAGILIWKAKGAANAPQYKTEAIRQGSLTVTVRATGTLQPINQVEVSSELSGIVKDVAVDYNDHVKVGQPLARLDTTKLEAQLTQSKAALESARAKLLQNQATVAETTSKLKQYKRVRELSDNKVPSQSEMDAAEAAFERAKADAAAARAAVSQAEATVQANETDLRKAVIRSPINGVVITRSVEPGQTVASSLQAPVLFELAEDLGQMQLEVDVDEADVGKVRQGQNASFSVDAYPDRSFQARITQVRYGSKTSEGVVTYQTILNVKNPDLSLRPGMTATADIVVRNVENAILVPNAALRFSPPQTNEEAKPSRGLVGSLLPRPPQQKKEDNKNDTRKKQQQVWLINKGKLTPVAVSTGATDGIVTEIAPGPVDAGTQVVVEAVAGTQ
jgi:HlyD family secretion protein